MSRQRLFTHNRIWLDDDNFLRIGDDVKVCRYIPERQTFEFRLGNKRDGRRFVEVTPQELVSRLVEIVV